MPLPDTQFSIFSPVAIMGYQCSQKKKKNRYKMPKIVSSNAKDTTPLSIHAHHSKNKQQPKDNIAIAIALDEYITKMPKIIHRHLQTYAKSKSIS